MTHPQILTLTLKSKQNTIITIHERTSDDEYWDLDELQSDHATVEIQSHSAIDAITSNSSSHLVGYLQYPVVLPQKRPSNKTRGFVTAYAPQLTECGVSQTAFLDFLDRFEKSIKVSLACLS